MVTAAMQWTPPVHMCNHAPQVGRCSLLDSFQFKCFKCQRPFKCSRYVMPVSCCREVLQLSLVPRGTHCASTFGGTFAHFPPMHWRSPIRHCPTCTCRNRVVSHKRKLYSLKTGKLALQRVWNPSSCRVALRLRLRLPLHAPSRSGAIALGPPPDARAPHLPQLYSVQKSLSGEAHHGQPVIQLTACCITKEPALAGTVCGDFPPRHNP
jgi:hypothetical protein